MITKSKKFQAKFDNLGAMPLSGDILTKANIGLWAFELDEGSEPRMYVDDTMLGLIGLTKQISPEETYHAWYDHIDPDHYDEVSKSVEKMKNAGGGQYDIILMDIQMPRMNGYEATKAIRALPDMYASTVPIVAMTANAFEEDKQNAFASGMNGHISKPIDILKLKATIAKFI